VIEEVKTIINYLILGMLTVNTGILWTMREMLRQHDQTLYGAKGGNGHDQEIKNLRARTDDHSVLLANHDLRMSFLHKKDHHQSGEV